MSEELEAFKSKIMGYSTEQLEEILISLNKDKFPEKYDAVRSILSNKMNLSLNPAPSQSNMEETIVDDTKLRESTTTLAPEEETIPEPVDPLSIPKKKTGVVKKPYKESYTKEKSFSQNDYEEENGSSFILLIFLVVTSLGAIYLISLNIAPLPGRDSIMEVMTKFFPIEEEPSSTKEKKNKGTSKSITETKSEKATDTPDVSSASTK